MAASAPGQQVERLDGDRQQLGAAVGVRAAQAASPGLPEEAARLLLAQRQPGGQYELVPTVAGRA